jgi:hypothetical protein
MAPAPINNKFGTIIKQRKNIKLALLKPKETL